MMRETRTGNWNIRCLCMCIASGFIFRCFICCFRCVCVFPDFPSLIWCLLFSWSSVDSLFSLGIRFSYKLRRREVIGAEEGKDIVMDRSRKTTSGGGRTAMGSSAPAETSPPSPSPSSVFYTSLSSAKTPFPSNTTTAVAPAQSPRMKSLQIFKIIVIGDSNVGKTCLTFRFCGGSFSEKFEPTIGVDFREKTVSVKEEEIKVETLM